MATQKTAPKGAAKPAAKPAGKQHEQAPADGGRDAFDWNAIVDAARERPEFKERLTFEKVGDEHTITIRSAQPYMVDFVNKKTGKEESFPVIDVTCQGLEMTLPVSAKSLQNELGRLAKDNDGSLQGITCRVRLIEYQHPQYGATKGYRVSRLVNEQPASQPNAG